MGLWVLLLGTAALGQVSGVPVLQPGATVTGTFLSVRVQTNRLSYLLSIPKAYADDSTRRFPLVLFLHGSGERGTNVQLVAVHGPPKQVREGKDFPFVLISPQCPPDQRWEPVVLADLLDEVEKAVRIDTHREYVTGLSMGGTGTWALAAHYPERFAAIAPICGREVRIDTLLSGRNAEALKTLGIWAFHGAKDSVVPLKESQSMVSAYEKLGNADVKLTVYPEVDHDSWTQAYNEPEFYSWLLAHHR
jgi:predicted peptidase